VNLVLQTSWQVTYSTGIEDGWYIASFLYHHNQSHARLAVEGPVIFISLELFTRHLAGKPFATDNDVKEAVISWLQTFDTDFFYTGYQHWCQGGTNAKIQY
jgi:hypothetical protein